MSNPTVPPNANEPQGQKFGQPRHFKGNPMAATMPKKNAWVRPVGGGAVLAIVLVVAIWRLNKASAGLNADKELNDPAATVQSVPEAQRAPNFPFDDGSTASLGPDTHVTIPDGFNKDVRAIRLVGTGSIKVAPRKKDTFDLRVGKAAIKTSDATIEVRADSGFPVIVRIRAGSAVAVVGKERHALATGDAIRSGIRLGRDSCCHPGGDHQRCGLGRWEFP